RSCSGPTRAASMSPRRPPARRGCRSKRWSRGRRMRNRKPCSPASRFALAAGQRIVYVDPYDGRILGQASPGVRRFFRVVTDWHRTLALTGDQRAVGKAITGACNLAFLFIVCSGLYLWWPKTWTRRQLRSITLFNGGLRGKARDFNWHNTIGFWSAVPLFVVVLGATVISYPWASDLPYRIV